MEAQRQYHIQHSSSNGNAKYNWQWKLTNHFNKHYIKLTFQFRSPRCPSAAYVLQTVLGSPESEADQVQVQCYSCWCWSSSENWHYHSLSSSLYRSQNHSLMAQLLLLHQQTNKTLQCWLDSTSIICMNHSEWAVTTFSQCTAEVLCCK